MAQHLARCAVGLGADDVKVIHSASDLVRVSFRGGWDLERALIGQLDFDTAYRHGSSYTDEEHELLLGCYYLGWSPERIAKLLRREENAVVQRLIHSGLMHECPDILTRGDLGLYDLEALCRGSLFKDDAEVLYEAGLLHALPSFEHRSINVAELPAEDRWNIHLLVLVEDPSSSLPMSNSAKDWEMGLSAARQHGVTLTTCYHYVKDASGLSMRGLFQRELLRAHAWTRCLETLPALLDCWVRDAKRRRSDYSEGSIRPPDHLAYPLTAKQVKAAPLELSILLNANNEQFLLPLMRQGHALAACFLTDIDRFRYRSDPTNSASDDLARRIQGDYWPSGQMISELLAPFADHDPIYARWMAWTHSQPQDSDDMLLHSPWSHEKCSPGGIEPLRPPSFKPSFDGTGGDQLPLGSSIHPSKWIKSKPSSTPPSAKIPS